MKEGTRNPGPFENGYVLVQQRRVGSTNVIAGYQEVTLLGMLLAPAASPWQSPEVPGTDRFQRPLQGRPSLTGGHSVAGANPRRQAPSPSIWADFHGNSTVFVPPITIHLALVAVYPELVIRREVRPLERAAAAVDRRSPGRSRNQAERMAREICVNVVSC